MTLPASRGEHFRFDMLSLGMTASGHMVGDVSCSLSGSIFDSIRTGGTLSWSGDDDLMPDWRHSLIRPMYVVQDQGEWPLGTLYCRAPRLVRKPGSISVSVQLFDRTLVTAESRLTQPLALPVGTPAVSTVVARLAALGETAVSVVPSSATLAAALSWDAGTTETKVCNDILSAVGYWSLHVDDWGIWQIAPYVLPAQRPIAFTFTPGQTAIHQADWSISRDDWQVPNRLTGIQRVDGDKTPLTSTQALPDSSPYSRRALGRWIDGEPLRNLEAANQTTLDAAVMRALLDKSDVASQVEISHAWQPEIRLGSAVRFARAGAGRWAYNKTSMDLTPGLMVKATLWEVHE